MPIKNPKISKHYLYNTGNENYVLLPKNALYQNPDDMKKHCLNEITKLFPLNRESIRYVSKTHPLKSSNKKQSYYYEILLNTGDTIYVSSKIHLKTQSVCCVFGVKGKGECIGEVTKEEFDKYRSKGG